MSEDNMKGFLDECERLDIKPHEGTKVVFGEFKISAKDGDEMISQMQDMLGEHKRTAAFYAATHMVDSLASLISGRFADAINHNRAVRAYAGIYADMDLLTEKEHRAYQAFRVIMAIADQPCAPETESELVKLAWSVLRTLNGDVIERAEILRDYMEVEE